LHTGILIVRQYTTVAGQWKLYTCTSFWFLILFRLWSLRRERSKYIRLSKRDRIYFYSIYVKCTPLQDPLLINRNVCNNVSYFKLIFTTEKWIYNIKYLHFYVRLSIEIHPTQQPGNKYNISRNFNNGRPSRVDTSLINLFSTWKKYAGSRPQFQQTLSSLFFSLYNYIMFKIISEFISTWIYLNGNKI
jgi:hypothetical protein